MPNPSCCLCGNLCDCKYGHNPEPIIDIKDENNHELRCCFFCNVSKVIPARLTLSGMNSFVSTKKWSDKEQK